MAKSKQFLVDISEEQLNLAMNEAEVSFVSINEVSEKIMSSYSQSLEEVMKKIYVNIIQTEGNYNPRLLDQYCLELTNILYFMQGNLETIGLKDDISKALAQETYNNAYLNSQIKDAGKNNKTTVAELTALAQEESKQESIVNFIYSRCYKLLKQKIDAGYEMVGTLRKIITKNIQEMQLSKFDNNIFTKGE